MSLNGKRHPTPQRTQFHTPGSEWAHDHKTNLMTPKFFNALLKRRNHKKKIEKPSRKRNQR